ncbi:MAG: Nif3-like dinuclear metal center hexameric protein [Armatimonadota bacterium]|nr:Nif3-like dinuclear metal center hexameric protein [Armatimonadota bacterium]
MLLRDIIPILEDIAPPERMLPDDRIGLMIGDPGQDVRSIVVTVDVTLPLLKSRSADLIIAHHPLIYNPLRSIRLDQYPQKIVYALVNAGVSLYVMHTNYDCADGGINDVLADRLGIADPQILKVTGGEKLFKLAVFVPNEAVDDVLNAVCEAGAGWIGNYSHCTFRSPGTGTFKPLEGATPYIGHVGELEQTAEFKLETIVPEKRLHDVLRAMLAVHPYEEVAYDVYPLWNKGKEWGLGRYGKLREPTTFGEFCCLVRDVLNNEVLRVSGDSGAPVETVAVVGGGGSGEVEAAYSKGVDVFVTGDLRHDRFVEARTLGLMVIDAGHFETERPGMIALAPRLHDILSPHGVTVEYVDELILGAD